MESINLYQADESKSMVDSIKKLFGETHRVLSVHSMLNALAMCALQSMGYNGFKRWHRYRSGQFHAMELCLANELFDCFRIKAEFKSYDLSYAPKSMEEHLKAWEGAILEAIKELGELQKKFVELTGGENRVIGKAVKKLSKDYKRVGRYRMRFEESDWLALDMHTVDRELHCKFKEKEERGKSWNGLMDAMTRTRF